MAKSIEPIKIKPIRYTPKFGAEAPYAEVTGGRVWRGKLLLNADVCAAILANGLNVLRLVVAEADGLAKNPPAGSRPAPPPLDSFNRAVEARAGHGRFNAESAPPEVAAAAQP